MSNGLIALLAFSTLLAAIVVCAAAVYISAIRAFGAMGRLEQQRDKTRLTPGERE